MSGGGEMARIRTMAQGMNGWGGGHRGGSAPRPANKVSNAKLLERALTPVRHSLDVPTMGRTKPGRLLTRMIIDLVSSEPTEPQVDESKQHQQEELAKRYAAMSSDQLCQSFGTHAEQGLTSQRAQELLNLYGPNEVTKEAGKSLCALIIDQFADLLVIMLMAAAIVSFALGQYAAATCIVLIVMANAILGVMQERKADAAINDLKEKAAPQCNVIRDGLDKTIDARDLVVGDVVRLALGDKVPADIRLLTSDGLSSSEAALNGESRPAPKHANPIGPEGHGGPAVSTDEKEAAVARAPSGVNVQRVTTGGVTSQRVASPQRGGLVGPVNQPAVLFPPRPITREATAPMAGVDSLVRSPTSGSLGGFAGFDDELEESKRELAPGVTQREVPAPMHVPTLQRSRQPPSSVRAGPLPRATTLSRPTTAMRDDAAARFFAKYSGIRQPQGPPAAPPAPPTEVAPAEGAPAPKKKEEHLMLPNMVYAGCYITEGGGTGVVTFTAMNTVVGRMRAYLNLTEKRKKEEGEMSPLQRQLNSLGLLLGGISLLISIVVFIIGVTTERGSDPASDEPVWLQMLLVAVSLTVAAVPEGLPACVTITLAVGMKHMAQNKAQARDLHAIETFGSASVICTDKTGTLTQGIMTAVKLIYNFRQFHITTPAGGYDPVGHVVPDDGSVNLEDNDHVARARTRLDNSGIAYQLPLLLSALCSNAQLAYVSQDHIERMRATELGKLQAKMAEMGQPVPNRLPADLQSKYDSMQEHWQCTGNLSERPLVVAAAKAGWAPEAIGSAFPRIHENPFHSSRKRMSTIVDVGQAEGGALATRWFGGRRYVASVKGAPNLVLDRCTEYVASEDGSGTRPMTADVRANLDKINNGLCDRAYRVLAIAYKTYDQLPGENQRGVEEVESKLVFCGFVASMDPERPEVRRAVEQAAHAGIRTVMITGDYRSTAKAIAENIGLLPPNSPDDKAVDCIVLREFGNQIFAHEEEIDRLRDQNVPKTDPQIVAIKKQIDRVFEQLRPITSTADVYARALPVDKVTILRSLQEQGCICSMTGDGANDAPALRQAEIGVAMGITGTDIAKENATIVLEDDSFATIVKAIEEGRTLYANITKFVYYLLSTNAAEVFLILVAVIMGLQSPLLPIQILWLNLVTDGLPAIALAIEGTEPGIMEEGPRSTEGSLISPVMAVGILIQTIVLTGLSLGTYILGLHWEVGSWDGEDDSQTDDWVEERVNRARTLTILFIVFAEIFRANTSRSLRQSIFSMSPFSNKMMLLSGVLAIGLTTFVALTPGVRDVFGLERLDWKRWMWVFGMSPVPAVVEEICKLIYRCTGFGAVPKVDVHAIKPHAQRTQTYYAGSTGPDNIVLSDMKSSQPTPLPTGQHPIRVATGSKPAGRVPTGVPRANPGVAVPPAGSTDVFGRTGTDLQVPPVRTETTALRPPSLSSPLAASEPTRTTTGVNDTKVNPNTVGGFGGWSRLSGHVRKSRALDNARRFVGLPAQGILGGLGGMGDDDGFGETMESRPMRSQSPSQNKPSTSLVPYVPPLEAQLRSGPPPPSSPGHLPERKVQAPATSASSGGGWNALRTEVVGDRAQNLAQGFVSGLVAAAKKE